jgi:hypothetical protein
MEDLRSGFSTRGEPHPAELVEGGVREASLTVLSALD